MFSLSFRVLVGVLDMASERLLRNKACSEKEERRLRKLAVIETCSWIGTETAHSSKSSSFIYPVQQPHSKCHFPSWDIVDSSKLQQNLVQWSSCRSPDYFLRFMSTGSKKERKHDILARWHRGPFFRESCRLVAGARQGGAAGCGYRATTYKVRIELVYGKCRQSRMIS
jgi:hypothetical protein